MASAAFKSTTRRALHDAAAATTTTRSDPPPCPRRTRSRSVSAAPRPGAAHGDYYANTRTNPLFDSAASPSASPPPPPGPAAPAAGSTGASSARGDAAGRERGREPRLKGGGGGGGGGRARSASVAPTQRWRHSASAPSVADSAGEVGGRRASRARSVADDARTYRGSEVTLYSLLHVSPGNCVSRKALLFSI